MVNFSLDNVFLMLKKETFARLKEYCNFKKNSSSQLNACPLYPPGSYQVFLFKGTGV